MESRDTAAPLRAQVALLGRLVGDALRTHARPTTFAYVERLRGLTRERRASPSAAIDAQIDALLDELSSEDAVEVIRAFGLYFQMVNLAEQLHRERRRRERALHGEPPLRGALETLSPQAPVAVDEVELTLVFTAHPTEVLRRTTSDKIAAIASALRDLDERVLTAEDRDGLEAELRAQILLLWQSNELYRSAPTVHDEVRNLVARFRESLFDEAPLLFERLEHRLGSSVPTMLHFGSWIGGDRDGNPNVAPDAIVAAHEQARRFVLERYQRAVEDLQVRFSQDAVRGEVSPELLASVEADSAALPDVRYTVGPRQEAEPYRRKLAFVHRRLTLALADREGAYGDAGAFLADLEVLERSAVAHSGDDVARPLRRLRRAVEIFGFHLCELEWRQHRDRVWHALDEVVRVVEPDRPVLSTRDDAALAAWFARELTSARPLIPTTVAFSPETADAIASLTAVAEVRRRRGAGAVRTFILAGTESAFDVLALHALARAVGALEAGPAQIVPLLESATALANAASLADALLDTAPFRAHVEGCGGIWEVMLGYSDTTKLMGPLASPWAVYRAQDALAGVGARRGVTLRFFHGRGGSVGRGAADAREAIDAQPAQARTGRFKVTEQGEVIGARYGLPSLARRNLELAFTSALRATREPAAAIPPRWTALLDRLAPIAERTYLELAEDPAFLDFFAAVTPLDEIGDMQISSRPGRRGARRSVGDLRAIPWAFAWTQARAMLPGWYGFGTAVRSVPEELDTLRAMASGFPFFSTLVRSVERALAVADLAIFERYVRGLLHDPAAAERYLPAIRAEHASSVEAVLGILGRDALLADDPTLARSIALRNPYVDPISLLQVRLLREYRARPDPVLRDTIRLSINGIAAGLRVTG
ncbi:MAG: Phosphoenolpyruvate carboxylase [Candidatus Eremiobacteraeota bacterium]|nr:Phosphoenolpyruvate carboxylase [Candidatus Eremiobacteraeota bacterium]